MQFVIERAQGTNTHLKNATKTCLICDQRKTSVFLLLYILYEWGVEGFKFFRHLFSVWRLCITGKRWNESFAGNFVVKPHNFAEESFSPSFTSYAQSFCKKVVKNTHVLLRLTDMTPSVIEKFCWQRLLFDLLVCHVEESSLYYTHQTVVGYIHCDVSILLDSFLSE